MVQKECCIVPAVVCGSELRLYPDRYIIFFEGLEFFGLSRSELLGAFSRNFDETEVRRCSIL